ncbi:hypothetical protein [Aeromicrobium sp. Leaf350]|uniref:hypothetical protein n=1 Tax=Aeromicrobium sp. Leaf350 TaxID=2876565 RepID=UPI001E50E48A|nr:hypothetical protein [Aeromicrobium sp. Leaf350]
MTSDPRRVVVAGLADGSGAEDALVRRARVLRDAGVEVVWAGSGLTPDQVAAIAVAEDADGVEVGDQAQVDPVAQALTARDADDVEVGAPLGEGDLTHG